MLINENWRTTICAGALCLERRTRDGAWTMHARARTKRQLQTSVRRAVGMLDKTQWNELRNWPRHGP